MVIVGAAEQKRLMAHVVACHDCLTAWMAAQAFESGGEARARDERLVARAVSAALARRSPRRRFDSRRAARTALLIAISLILAAALASAGIVLHRLWRTAAAPGLTR